MSRIEKKMIRHEKTWLALYHSSFFAFIDLQTEKTFYYVDHRMIESISMISKTVSETSLNHTLLRLTLKWEGSWVLMTKVSGEIWDKIQKGEISDIQWPEQQTYQNKNVSQLLKRRGFFVAQKLPLVRWRASIKKISLKLGMAIHFIRSCFSMINETMKSSQ